MKGSFLLVCALALAIPSAVLARTWYITPDGTGDAETIQAGIDAAAAGDTVLLADGTYTGDGNRDIRYYGKAITVRSASGDPELCVIDCQATEADEHRGFFFNSGEDSSSVLEAVTITGGNIASWHGGGIACNYGSPRITGCIVTGNHAKNGGGIACVAPCSAIITDCIASGNSAGGGGGMHFHHSIATLINVVCIGNSATGIGGGVGIHAATNTFIGCTFARNSASVAGGGADCCAAATPIFHNCTFVNNSAPLGGGISCTWYGPSHITLDHTIIANNGQGEALYCEESECTAELSCCDVYGNDGGDWVGCIAGQEGINGNFSADPRFCDPDNDDHHLYSDSPCAPGNHPDGWACGLIGSFDIGCCVGSWVGAVTTYEGVISVPIEVSDVTNLGVYSAEVIIDYRPNILRPTGFDTTGTLVDGLGWFSGWSELEPGRCKVSMGGVAELVGEETLVIFTFEVTDGAPCKGCTDLELEVMLNEGDPCVEVTGGGEYCLPVETISGTALYYGCPKLGTSNPPIPGADVVVVKYGVPPDSLGEAGMTDSLGQYLYPGCKDTCYTMTVQKAPGETIGISSLDASLVLQYTLEQESLSVCPIYPMLMPDSSTWCPEDTVYAQQVAADVSGNGTITAYDVSAILRYVVGLDGEHCGEWLFYCDHRDYCPLDESWEDQDYVGVLLGEVSGDWEPEGSYGGGVPAGYELVVGDVIGAEGELVGVPVRVNMAEEIVSLQFRILHDPELLTVESAEVAGQTSAWQLAYNPLPGETRVALAGADAIGESGEILLIQYRVTSEPGVSQCSLDPIQIVADEGRVFLEGDGGVFSLEGASVEDEVRVREAFSEVNPNPASGAVEIMLGVPVTSRVGIAVYDASGRLVRRLVSDETFSAGETTVRWDRASKDGRQVSPGVYFVKVEVGSYSRTHRVVIVE